MSCVEESFCFLLFILLITGLFQIIILYIFMLVVCNLGSFGSFVMLFNYLLLISTHFLLIYFVTYLS